MGKIKQPEPVKLMVGMLAREVKLFGIAGERLVEHFGEIDFESGVLPFDATDYYQAEMGPSLLRKFISFRHLIMPERLPEIKRLTNRLEAELSDDQGNRRVNLDPAYLSLSKLVLATTKDQQHRLYLGEGIYGEVTLRFVQGSFRPWDWTYTDYKTSAYIEIFHAIRHIYQQQLRRSPKTS